MRNEYNDRLKAKVKSAVEATKLLCEQYSGVKDITSEDMVILAKYVDRGLIKLTIPKKGVGEHLYLPLMCDPAYKGLSLTLWLTVLLKYMPKYGIKYRPTKASAASYYYSFEEYADKYNIKAIVGLPYEEMRSAITVISNDDAGKLGIADEIGMLNELIEDEEV